MTDGIDIPSIMTIVAGLGGGGGMVGGIAWYMLRGLVSDLRRQLAEMTQRVEQLETRDMEQLKTRMVGYESRCSQHHAELAVRLRQLDQLVADERNTVGWIKKLDNKLDRIAEDTAAIKAGLGGHEKWLGNLDAQHQSHVHNMTIHGGK